MSGTEERTPRVTLARDAVEFIDRVERMARERGSEEPCLHHWVAAACDRPFLARTVARAADVAAARELLEDALSPAAAGPRWPRDTVLDAARQTAIGRGDRQVRAWHLVLVALQRFGIAGRDAGNVVLATEEPPATAAASGAAATARPGPRPSSGPPRRVPDKHTTPSTPLLDACGTDWTALAARGALPPCVGRDAELRLLVEALCRPTKSNVLLVGEPGVGKSALVEGLALCMAEGDVPGALLGRPLIALDLAELTRDSRYYGVMEQRVSALIDEARRARAILFLDEGHAMTGSGGREGTGDVASVFKPALARDGLSLITATTEDEYRRFIAPNGALERRFNVVRVLEPDRATVMTMLAAHRDRIAATHGVGVTDAALARLVEVTASRLSHRREPDRSRDLLDQAVARAIAAGADAVTPEDVERTARKVSGAPEVTDDALASLRGALTRDGVLADADADALVERLALAYAGLALHAERPRAVALLLRRRNSPDGFALADAIAAHVFGAPERVVAIDVGGIKEPSAISGLLGTTQGYVGHGALLPIHGLAERPHSVLLLRGVDAAHDSLRALLARAILDGYLTDAQARRIPLAQTVIVLEAGLPQDAGRPIGFRTGADAETDADGDPATSTRLAPGRVAALADAAVGEPLQAACDLVVMPPPGARTGAAGWASRALRRLAEAYGAAGVELVWDVDVEAALGAAMASVPSRERERVIESRVGRAVRPCLRSGRRPARARVVSRREGLVAELEA